MMREYRWILAVMFCGMALLWAGCQNPALTGAKVYIQQQDWDNALVQLKIAVEQEPQNAEAHFLLGRAYSEKTMYPEMVKAFRTSLEAEHREDPRGEVDPGLQSRCPGRERAGFRQGRSGVHPGDHHRSRKPRRLQ